MGFAYVPGRQVEVPEINYAESVDLNAEDTAVIVVDMQNDFVKEGGSLRVDSALATIPSIRELLNRARRAGSRVIYTQDTHDDGDPEWQIWPEHCRRDTEGWEIVEELAPNAGDLVCIKNRYDGFYGTSLEHWLRVWNIRNVVIVGTVSSICVAHTAASAGLRWYNIVVPADGVSAITEFDQALTLRQVSWLYVGSVVKSTVDIQFSTGESR